MMANESGPPKQSRTLVDHEQATLFMALLTDGLPDRADPVELFARLLNWPYGRAESAFWAAQEHGYLEFVPHAERE